MCVVNYLCNSSRQPAVSSVSEILGASRAGLGVGFCVFEVNFLFYSRTKKLETDRFKIWSVVAKHITYYNACKMLKYGCSELFSSITKARASLVLILG